jgi:hypothetical protein
MTPGEATGTLDGVSVTVTGGFSSVVGSLNLSGSDFSAAPLSTTAETVTFLAEQPLAFTFGSPVSNLSLYLAYWLGGGASCTGSPAGVYTFSATPTIASGIAGSSLSGNVLSLFGNWQSGIVTFAGPLTSLTVSAGCGTATSASAFTLSVQAVPPPVSAPILNLNQPAVIYSEEIDVTK